MLVLSRKKNEQIRITVPPSAEPTKILITVVRVQPGVCRLGFDARRDVAVVRAELPEKTQPVVTNKEAKK